MDLGRGIENRSRCGEVQSSTFARFLGSFDFRLLQQYLPLADIGCLLDHLVGASKQRWRNGDAERTRRLQIDREFEPCWLLERQVAGLGSLDNAVDIARR